MVAFERIWVPQPNRLHQGDAERGEYIFHSVPLFAPLLNNQSRVLTAPDERVATVRVLEQVPVPDGFTSAAEAGSDVHGDQQVYVYRRLIGEAPLLEDGSVRMLVPSRTPLVMQLLDGDGNVLDWQREEEQIGSGETQPRTMRSSPSSVTRKPALSTAARINAFVDTTVTRMLGEAEEEEDEARGN